MNNTRRTYLLTLHSPSQRALRLWTGQSIHTLRHCSVKEIGGALVEMQRSLDDLQKSMQALQHVKEQLVSESTDGVGGTGKDNESLKAAARFSEFWASSLRADLAPPGAPSVWVDSIRL